MPSFAFVALDAQGQQVSDHLDAANQTEAINLLRGRGLFPTSVKEQAAGKGKGKKPPAPVVGKSSAAKKPGGFTIPFLQKKTIKSKTLMIFTRQLATLIDAGLPLLRGLTVLGNQEPDPVLKRTISDLAESVQGGSTFSDSLITHPKIFNKLYVNMVKAGELGGVLEIVLNRLAEFQEKSQKIKGKVVSAMVYPLVVLVIAAAILTFLLIFIVPKFQQIFADALPGQPLPAVTQFVIGCSHLLVGQWYIIVGLIALGVFAYKFASSTPAGVFFLDRIALRIPIFGDLSTKTAISRFARTLGTLISSGVPILQALNITRDTAGNTVVANAINKIHDSVKEGESVVGPMESSAIFPPMVTSMVQVGEETGQLPDMLVKVADVYEAEVDNVVTGLTSILEPIMIVMLAVIVGTIVIALFMPMVGLITGMSDAGAAK